jgi:tRNA(fMet)-specific endonuclease VapC
VIYLLDTNACIAILNGDAAVRGRFARAHRGENNIAVSTLTAFELWYGVAKSARVEHNRTRVESFLSGPISLISFDDADAQAAGTVRAGLERAGAPIGAYDVLIAGHALSLGAVLVTNNAREFGRVPDLALENWARGDA